MSSGGRGIIVRIWNNFLSSITTKQSPHREVGRDHFGNKYFEIAADPSRGKRKPRRWFEPRIKDNFSADMPPEWEAWLRTRRVSPPTEEVCPKGRIVSFTKWFIAAMQERLEGHCPRWPLITVPPRPGKSRVASADNHWSG
ncbi:NADH dehydrogenase [ubiquinone] 1 alpha subcomplex assembly factor 2 isoform X4 [Dermacentor albipictus]|uniref:NADH dehydrogenase [ubiquinone] 1 alpha subcomplex assembly factor 2 isoform X4 n=1 Tax=Dermacentor albipictus TaxID=60249 RepID=UPI0031FCCD7E